MKTEILLDQTMLIRISADQAMVHLRFESCTDDVTVTLDGTDSPGLVVNQLSQLIHALEMAKLEIMGVC